jgi:hypothetical protein
LTPKAQALLYTYSTGYEGLVEGFYLKCDLPCLRTEEEVDDFDAPNTYPYKKCSICGERSSCGNYTEAKQWECEDCYEEPTPSADFWCDHCGWEGERKDKCSAVYRDREVSLHDACLNDWLFTSQKKCVEEQAKKVPQQPHSWKRLTTEVTALVKQALAGRKLSPGFHMKVLSLLRTEHGFKDSSHVPSLALVKSVVDAQMGKMVITPTMVNRKKIDLPTFQRALAGQLNGSYMAATIAPQIKICLSELSTGK